MRQVAQEIGVSDVGFKNACKRLSVLSPKRGYWANSIADFHDPFKNGKFDELQSDQGLDSSLNCDEEVENRKFPLPQSLKHEIQRLLEP